MTDDWLEDETMSPEETMARFEALPPEPAVGPSGTLDAQLEALLYKAGTQAAVAAGMHAYAAAAALVPAPSHIHTSPIRYSTGTGS